MIRSGRFSFDKIQVIADNKFSEIGVMGIHRVFESSIRDSKALEVSFVSLRKMTRTNRECMLFIFIFL